MNQLIEKLHTRLGDFWWYSLLLFVALRFGDVINAVVGLWLVPKYVPAEELGAVLPLTQFASFFGLPLTILVVVFTRYLNYFKTKGEDGKVKSLLVWFISFSIVFTVITSVAAFFLLPHLFERIRVVSGSLGFLIIATGVANSLSPVFSNALQSLKKFNAMTIQNLFAAPLRLVVMVVAIPYRALSGYMAGQLSIPLFTIGWSCFNLRNEFKSTIKAVPFWKDDLKNILRYLMFIAVWHISGAVASIVHTTIIRQRLPEVESAAYYMISRFAEFSTFAGVTLMLIMFPLAAEAHTRGEDTWTIFRKTTTGTVVFGALITAVLYFGGEYIFNLIPACRPYVTFVPEMSLLAVNLSISQVWTNFTSHEMACNRFRFLSYNVPLNILHTVILVAFTGFTFFDGIIPQRVMDFMAACNLGSLRNILLLQLSLNVIRMVFIYFDMLSTRKKEVALS